MTTKEVMFDSVEGCKAVLSSRARSSRKISTYSCGSCMVDGKSILEFSAWGFIKN